MLTNSLTLCTHKQTTRFYSHVVLSIVLLVTFTAAAQAATYYVSTQGSDSNPGTLNQPWRSIDYAARQVAPGDTVLVRGGVYYETVTSRTSGTASQRITFKAYPGETPVIDGTAKVTGWTKCTGSKDFLRPNGTSIGSLPGNANYANIYKARVPVEDIGDPSNVAIYENGEYMFTSSYPAQANNVFDDETTYQPMASSCYGQSAYLNCGTLTQPDDFWNGSTVKVWVHANNNTVSTRTVSDYNASQKRITFSSSLPASLGDSGSLPDAYAIQNHWSLLNKKGTAYITTTAVNGYYTLYVWPQNPSQIENNITVSKRDNGFWMSSASYVTIDGFVIRGIGRTTSTQTHRSGGIANTAGWTHTGLEIRNCTIKNSAGYGGITLWAGNHDIIENNVIENCRSGYGIAFRGTSSARNYNSIIRNNTIRQIRSTGLKIIYATNIQITGNTASDFGSHANGCSLYQFNENVLFAHNTITNARNALTLKESRNVTVYCNILEGAGSTADGNYVLAAWSAGSGTPMSGQVAILNNLILSKTGTISLYISNSPQTQADWIIKNNIIDGYGWDDGISPNMTHNLYVDYSWQQNKSTYRLNTGEYHYENYDAIFADYGAMNFAHAKDGYATGKAAGIAQYLPTATFSDYNYNRDITGKSRNASSISDLGPYAAGSAPVIDAPVADAGSDQTVAYDSRAAIQLDGSGSSGYGTLTYEWTQNGTLIETGVSPVISLNPGTHTIVLTVKDGQSPSQQDTDTVVITVLESAGEPQDPDLTLRDGLVGEWLFNEQAGTVIEESSGHSNTAILSDASMRTQDGCLDFTSAQTYAMTASADASLNLTGSLTLAAWINPRSYGESDYGRIVDKGLGSAGQGFSLMLNGNSRHVGYVTYGGDYVSSTDDVVPLNTWTHVCAVYDEQAQTVSFYINGQPAGSSAYTRSPVGSAGDPLYIGLRGYDNSRHFDGLMDDVSVYNRSLSASQVQELYNSKDDNDNTPPAAPLGLWRLDDFSGDQARDASGNHYTAALLDGPAWGMPWKGCQDEFLNFNGQTQAMEISSQTLKADSGTIVLKAKPFSTSGLRFLFGHDYNHANKIWLYTISGKLGVGMGDNSFLSAGICTLDTDTLYHIALAWDGSDYCVYVDGQLVDSGGFSGLTQLAQTADVANMGTVDYRRYELGFDGIIEDVRTYDCALSAKQVAELATMQESRENECLEFYVFGEDRNGSPITYTAGTLPDGAVFDEAEQKLTWRPGYDQSGEHRIQFSAKDGSDQQSVTVTVRDVQTRSWYTNFLTQQGKL